MRVFPWYAPDDDAVPPSAAPAVRSLAIGVFDGVHRGHQELLRRVTADDPSGAAVLTFSPAPVEVLRREHYEGAVVTPEQRLELLKDHGIATVLQVVFGPSFAVMPGAQFIRRLHAMLPALRHVVVGYNFHMGHHRDIDAPGAREFFQRQGIRVDIVPALKDNGLSMSSSRVRRAIATGDLDTAERILGRRFAIDVTAGAPDRREACRQILPPAGVYACTYRQGAVSREGMMEITESGGIQWEPLVTATHLVIPRRRIDVSDSRTEE